MKHRRSRRTSNPSQYLTIIEKRGTQGNLNVVGGPAALADLADAVPSAANVAHYATIVREKALLRKILQACREIVNSAASDQAKAEDVQAQFQRAAFELVASNEAGSRKLRPVSEILTDTIEHIQRSTDQGIVSGLLEIDRFTRGLRPSQLIVIGARPSMGKSALALDLAVGALKQASVAFFSIEMSEQELTQRLLAKRAGVNLHNIRSGRLARPEWDQIIHAMGEIADFPLFIDDSGSLSVSQIRARVQEIAVRTGRRVGLAVVDYLQLISTEGRYTSRDEKVGSITRGLKLLSKDLAVPVIALSQLNRKLEDRPFKDHQRRPQKGDFRESGSIEADADVMIGIYRPEEYSPDPKYKGRAEAIFLKQRNGPTGIARLFWDAPTATFRNAAPEGMDMEPVSDRAARMGL